MPRAEAGRTRGVELSGDAELDSRVQARTYDAKGRAELEAGDLVILAHGHGHELRDDPASPISFLDDLLAETPPVDGRLSRGGTGARTEILWGGLALEGGSANPVLAGLPAVVHVGAR